MFISSEQITRRLTIDFLIESSTNGIHYFNTLLKLPISMLSKEQWLDQEITVAKINADCLALSPFQTETFKHLHDQRSNHKTRKPLVAVVLQRVVVFRLRRPFAPKSFCSHTCGSDVPSRV